MNPNTFVTIIGRNSFFDFLGYSVHTSAVTLTFDLLALKVKTNQHMRTQMHLWPKLDEIPFIRPIIWDKQEFLCSHHINFRQRVMNRDNKVNLVLPDVGFYV